MSLFIAAFSLVHLCWPAAKGIVLCNSIRALARFARWTTGRHIIKGRDEARMSRNPELCSGMACSSYCTPAWCCALVWNKCALRAPRCCAPVWNKLGLVADGGKDTDRPSLVLHTILHPGPVGRGARAPSGPRGLQFAPRTLFGSARRQPVGAGGRVGCGAAPRFAGWVAPAF